MLPCAIIGGGPAGMSAALWLKYYGIESLIIDRNDALGGALLVSGHANHWVLGQEDCNGLQMAERFARHIENEAIATQLSTEVRSIAAASHGFTIGLNTPKGHKELHCQKILLATGITTVGAEAFRGIEGFSQAQHAIHFGQPTLQQIEGMQGITAAVVGGGDNAFEAALALNDNDCAITLVMRSDPKAQQQLQQLMASRESAGAIEVIRASRIVRFECEGDSITLHLSNGQKLTIMQVFALLGYRAATDWVKQQLAQLEVDAYGFIKTDAALRTSIPGLYAAGDVASPDFASVAPAIASGSLAARTLQRDLDASCR